MYHIIYRKPEYHKTFPWNEYFHKPEEVLDFINKLGDEYDFIIFEEISLSDLEDMVRELEE